jgi:iron complex transport system substrate-binding protein
VQFFEQLGFANSPKIEELKSESFYVEVSKEQVALLDADLTVVFGIGAGTELKNDTVLNSIASAKDGRMLIIDDADLANAFSTYSVLSVPYTLEKIVPLVKAALA